MKNQLILLINLTYNTKKLFTQWFTMMLTIKIQIFLLILWNAQQINACPSSEDILPCRCSIRGTEKQIW